MKVYVYFINDGHGHMKIGISNNPEKRLRSIQTGNPYKLSIDRVEKYSTYEDAFRRETELHNKFKDYNLHGEWFDTVLVDLFSKFSSPTYEDYIDTVLSRHLCLK